MKLETSIHIHLETLKAAYDDKVTKTFKITATDEFLKRFEKFLGLLEMNGNIGHSALCGIYVDGDGSDRPKFEPTIKPKSFKVNKKGSYPNDIETAS